MSDLPLCETCGGTVQFRLRRWEHVDTGTAWRSKPEPHTAEPPIRQIREGPW